MEIRNVPYPTFVEMVNGTLKDLINGTVFSGAAASDNDRDGTVTVTTQTAVLVECSTKMLALMVRGLAYKTPLSELTTTLTGTITRRTGTVRYMCCSGILSSVQVRDATYELLLFGSVIHMPRST